MKFYVILTKMLSFSFNLFTFFHELKHFLLVLFWILEKTNDQNRIESKLEVIFWKWHFENYNT